MITRIRGCLATVAHDQVTVTVDAANAPPTARNDTFTVQEDSANNILDVLANDSDQPDQGETLTVIGAGRRRLDCPKELGIDR